MQDLFRQLGIDWRLLVTQGVNFFVVLVILTALVYRPLLRLLAERRKKIELGLKGAEEVERRIGEIEAMKSRKLAAADREAVAVIGQAEKNAKSRGQAIIAESHEKAEALLAEAAAVAERRKLEELERLAGEAETLVRTAIARAVELDPQAVDAKLVARAAKLLSGETL